MPDTSDEDTGMIASAATGTLEFKGQRLLKISMSCEKGREDMPEDISITRIEGKVKSILSVCLKVSTDQELSGTRLLYMLPPICTLDLTLVWQRI
jgi:hypothetical protein